VAVKFNAWPTTNPPPFGVSVTLSGPATAAVIVAAAVLVSSETEVAVNVTVAGLGTLAGAV
jgi:hypothetical protein